MILSFSMPQFESLIKENIKIHTIRKDKNNRWKVGNSIQFWNGNPRNTHSKKKPYQFGIGVVERVLPIEILPLHNKIIIENLCFEKENLEFVATNDGFESWIEMKTFFNEPFKGKLIIWKEFKKLDLSEETLLNLYLKGFNDCLDNKINFNNLHGLQLKAYKLGKDNAILGDDLSHIDNLTNEEILDKIFK